MPSGARRDYASTLRREQAEATWERIVAAARALMLDRGYAHTSMAAVAKVAGVAPQTLYAACPGGKVGLAKLVYNVTLMGDADATPMNQRPEFQALIDNPDPRAKLRGYAAINARVYDRLAPVIRMLRAAAAAAPGDGDLTTLLEDAETRRLAGAVECAENLQSVGGLRPGLTPELAGQQLFALSVLEGHDSLVRRCGWTSDEFADWLGERMIDAVLARPAREPTGA
jgi:AcrR family transcriptional regulator